MLPRTINDGTASPRGKKGGKKAISAAKKREKLSNKHIDHFLAEERKENNKGDNLDKTVKKGRKFLTEPDRPTTSPGRRKKDQDKGKR